MIILSIFIFFLQSFCFGLVGARFLRNTELRDHIFFYKIVGIIFTFLPLYLLCYSLNISSYIAYPVILSLYLAVIFFYKFDRKDIRAVLIQELIFITFVVLFMGLYAWGPKLAFGEKPMDLGLLAFFSKYPNLPAVDHWFVSEKFSYYDFGHFFFGTILGYFNIELEWKYYLSLSFVASLAIISITGIIDFIKGKSRLHIILAPLFLFLTPFVVFNYFSQASSVSLFWNFTRVFDNGFFFEFPLWSFLFSDLHPHVMMIPFAIVSLFFAVTYFLSPKSNELMALWLASSLILILGNTWDFLWGAIFVAPFILGMVIKDKKVFKNKALYIAVLLCVLININFLLTGKFASTGDGQFIQFEYFQFGAIAFIKSFGISYLLFLVASFLWIKKDKWMGPIYFISGAWALFALSMIILNDRLNSIFKGGSYLYLLITLSSLLIIYKFTNLKKISPILVYSILGIFISISSWGSFRYKNSLFEINKIESRFSEQQKELLAYLRSKDANYSLFTPYLKTYDYKAIEFLSFSGVPLVMGWDNHLFVRGKSWDKLKEVERDMNQFYANPTIEKAQKLFEKYQMQAIYFPEGNTNFDLKFGVLLERN